MRRRHAEKEMQACAGFSIYAGKRTRFFRAESGEQAADHTGEESLAEMACAAETKVFRPKTEKSKAICAEDFLRLLLRGGWCIVLWLPESGETRVPVRI
ncbi:MAG: hypothetical protein IKJ11_09815 [Clostridia bacterium]|nr:hypothetical protein [Clostridia bacterium]